MQIIPPEVALSELDSILGPVLAYSSGSAESRALALLTKGLDREEPLSPEAIRLWVLSRCVDGYMLGSASDAIGGRHGTYEHRGHSRSRRSRDIAYEMRSLAKSEGWGQLVASARKRVNSSSGDGRDVRGASLDIARRIVAGVLMELPGGHGPGQKVLLSRNVGARAALMVIGLMILEDGKGWDSVLLSQQKLGAELGMHWQTARGHLDLLVERNVLTSPRSRKFVASRYRVKKPYGQRREFAQQWGGVARDLVDGTAGRVEMVLRSVTHPAWTYSDKLRLKHWALLLADAAEVDPTAFGISQKEARTIRRELKSEYEVVPGVLVPYLNEILDRLADDTTYGTTDKKTGERITARVAKERAMAAYAEQAAVNKATAEAATELKKEGYATLDALLEAHPVPKTPFSSGLSQANKKRREQDSLAWVSAVHRLILSEAPNETARKIVGGLLIKRLVKKRYPSGFAEGIVSYVMHAENDVTLEEWMSQASADDGPSIPSRRRG